MSEPFIWMVAGWIVAFCGDELGDRFIGMIVCLVFAVLWWTS